jgi:hypothetical protein
MSKKAWVVSLVVGVSSLATFQAARAEEKASWQGKMQALAQTMGELLPELVSRKGDITIIEKDAKTLSELSHSLKPGLKSGKMVPPQDADPSLQIIAGKFSEETKYAYRAIHAGNVEYGKNILKGVTSYCIACHTRHDKGPDFPVFPLNPKTDRLAPEEKAELYVATRQFDKGLEAFEGLIKDNEFAKKRPFDWEHAVRNALAISVRVKNDPAASLKIVELALSSPNIPAYTKAYLGKWKQAIEAWKTSGIPSVTNETKLAAQMRKLMSEAKDGQIFPADYSSEVQYLRASAVAHDLLREAKDSKIKAEGLLTIGTAYEVLSNPTLWPMHELYYEACVHELPHSALAMKCYERYEQSVYMGYTGSAGTFIPDEVQVLLAEMKELAKPKGK